MCPIYAPSDLNTACARQMRWLYFSYVVLIYSLSYSLFVFTSATTQPCMFAYWTNLASFVQKPVCGSYFHKSRVSTSRGLWLAREMSILTPPHTYTQSLNVTQAIALRSSGKSGPNNHFLVLKLNISTEDILTLPLVPPIIKSLSSTIVIPNSALAWWNLVTIEVHWWVIVVNCKKWLVTSPEPVWPPEIREIEI